MGLKVDRSSDFVVTVTSWKFIINVWMMLWACFLFLFISSDDCKKFPLFLRVISIALSMVFRSIKWCVVSFGAAWWHWVVDHFLFQNAHIGDIFQETFVRRQYFYAFHIFLQLFHITFKLGSAVLEPCYHLFLLQKKQTMWN